MTAADPLLPSLDERIAAAFGIDAKSADVATLIKNTERAASSAAELAEQARNHALDPTLSGNQLKDAWTMPRSSAIDCRPLWEN